MERLTGNQLWKLRTKHGRDKLFNSGALLREEAIKYFDWCDRHPWLKSELVKYKGDYEEAEVPLGRPYTMDGLTVYLGVSGGYFRAAKSNIVDKRERGRANAEDLDVLDAIEWIEQVVRTQQVEGAAVGVFNTNLVARLNGIADNVNQNNTGDAVLRVTVRDQETADNLDALEDLL
jgi:hypothetical protein